MQRQYTGTAGRTENAQVAVYLSYAGRGGHTLIDRELYLPKSWTGDLARCRAAGIPHSVEFATKPALACRMITRTLDAGIPAAWVTGDEVYGQDPGLRADSKPAGSVTSWLWPAITASPPRPGNTAPVTWPPARRDQPGSGAPLAPAPRATGITTGH